MSEKIVLIDGHSILNRAFYGLPELTNSEGLHTNAVYGFLNIMFKILDEEMPQYLTVAFDTAAPTFRHKMYPAYKGTRKPMPRELSEQVPVIKEVLTAMKVKIIEKEGIEADDVLGTLATRCEKRGLFVTILSGDRDLLQLATDRTKIRIPKTRATGTEMEDYYARDVISRYGVTPTEFIDLKALMGDTSDNIPGVPSIGEKTAAAIIEKYGSVENAFEHADELKPPRAAKMLKEHYELARLSKILSTIKIDADFPYDIEDARLRDMGNAESYALFMRLEFKSMAARVRVRGKADEPPREKFVYRKISDSAESAKIFDKAKAAKDVGAALLSEPNETVKSCDKNLSAPYASPRGAAIALAEGEVYVVVSDGGDFTPHDIFSALEEISRHAAVFAMFNIKDALTDLSGLSEKSCFDCAVASYLINPLSDTDPRKDAGGDDMRDKDGGGEDRYERAAREASLALTSYPGLSKKLDEMEMKELFRDIEMPLVFTLHEMEQNGVRVDAKALAAYGETLGERIKDVEKRIYDETGEKFNLNSPKQLGDILFGKMGLPHGKKTKNGYSTSADVLKKLAPEYKVVSDILDYRQLSKLKSTYADGLANFIREDGRIHCRFNQTATATGRISSAEPNLQNIPVRMELGRRIREVFIPEDGYEFVDADYSQIELRVLTHCSGDERLISAYRDAKDLHRITASEVFHVKADEVTDAQRRNAKAVNFGIIYGISSFGLSEDLSITRKEAEEYIENYFKTYPKVKAYLDSQVAFARERGYVTTIYHRRRPVPEINSKIFSVRSFGERVAMNTPIQGSAADIMKIAMIRVHGKLKSLHMKSRLVLQVHDELLIEAAKEETLRVKEILREEMEHAADLAVPLTCDVNVGKNWLEAK